MGLGVSTRALRAHHPSGAKMVSAQTALEMFGFIAFFAGFPCLILFVFDPVVRFARQNTVANQVSVRFYAHGVECGTSCIRAEQRLDKDRVMDLSLVIPAYNEEKRLPVMLDKAATFLQAWSLEEKINYEIVVADDGSNDGTALYVLNRARLDPTIRLVSLGRNCGKGGAVKRGVNYSRGKYVLMADADGATEISDLPRLWSSLHENQRDEAGLAIGSRAHLEKESIATRSLVRTVLMRGFHILVMLLCTSNVRDTQCGFKLFTRKAARLLFSNLHLEGWTFDIEIIVLAEQLGIPISEVPVTWNEVEGSKLIQNKLDVVLTSLKMARDMLCLRLSYLLGIWAVNPLLL